MFFSKLEFKIPFLFIFIIRICQTIGMSFFSNIVLPYDRASAEGQITYLSIFLT